MHVLAKGKDFRKMDMLAKRSTNEVLFDLQSEIFTWQNSITFTDGAQGI